MSVRIEHDTPVCLVEGTRERGWIGNGHTRDRAVMWEGGRICYILNRYFAIGGYVRPRSNIGGRSPPPVWPNPQRPYCHITGTGIVCCQHSLNQRL